MDKIYSSSRKRSARTNGAIDVEIYDSAQLYKDKEVPAVGSGAIEAGVASLTRYVGDAPVVDVLYAVLVELRRKCNTVAEGSVVRTTIEKEVARPAARFFTGRHMVGQSFCRRVGQYERGYEGKKARVFGKTLGDFVTAAGGAPTLISGSEQYRLSARYGRYRYDGCLRCEITEALGSDGSVTVTNHADIEFVVVVNTDWWNGLSSEIQGHIRAAASVARKVFATR